MRLSFLLWPLLLSLPFAFVNCHKTSAPEEPVCTGDCLFQMKNAAGTVVHMDCFDQYAIRTQHPQNDSAFIYGLPDALDARFQEEGKSVIFSGTFRANTLTPTFPDPSFSPEAIYQLNISGIR